MSSPSDSCKVKQIAQKGQTNQSLFAEQFTGGKPSSFQLTIFAHTHWFKLSRMVRQKNMRITGKKTHSYPKPIRFKWALIVI